MATARHYSLTQEFITPYTPQENGLCERFIRTIKQECFWQHKFANMMQARVAITRWVNHYNQNRPHSSLNYQTPDQRWPALQSPPEPLTAAA